MRVAVKRPRNRMGQSTLPAVVNEKAGCVWSIDLQFDSAITGKLVKALSIVAEHTRECLGAIVDYSITGLDFAEQTDQIMIDLRMPVELQTDNGPAFISNADES